LGPAFQIQKHTVSIWQCSKFTTQLCGVSSRHHPSVNVSSFLCVGEVDIQHTNWRLITLQLRWLNEEHGRADGLSSNIPHPHVHVASILAECSETYVQRFFRLATIANDSVWLDDRRFVCLGARFNDGYKVAGNVDVLAFTI